MQTVVWSVLAAALVGGISGTQAAQGQDCVYVLDQFTNAVHAVERSSKEVVGNLPMPTDDCPQAPCHPMPTALDLFDGETVRAYVSRQDVNLLYVIDPVAGTVVDTVTIDSGEAPMAGSAAAALSPDGSRLYIANLSVDSLSVVDTSTNELIDTVDLRPPTGRARPRGVAVTPDGTTVVVANSSSDTVSLIRASDRTVIDTVPVGDAPAGVGVTTDGTRAYVTNGNAGSVSVLDIASRTVVDTIPVGQSPRAIAFSPNGALAYVTNVLSRTVSVIDVATGEIVGDPITVGPAPVAIAVTSDGATAYVANLMGNSVSVINLTNRAVDTIPDLTAPFDLALGPCPAPSCVGDCDGSGTVVVGEIITGVNIALGNQPITACPAFDANGDQQVAVNELIRAVNNLLLGCSG